MDNKNECDVCGTPITGKSKNELVDRMVWHARSQHDLQMTVEEAKAKAERKPKGSPGISAPQS